MCRIISLIVLIFTFVEILHATNYPILQPASDPTESGNWNRTVIPLKRCGNLLLMEATVDSIVGDFIIDTGAPYLILNSTYFRNYPAKQTLQTAGLNANTTTAIRSEIKNFNAQELQYKNVEVDITGLKQIEDKCNMRILGLMGANMFSSFLMRIDTRKNQLVLYRLDEQGNTKTPLSDSLDLFNCERKPNVNLRFKWCDNKIMLPVSIANKEMNWMFDSGAETNVVDVLAQKKILKEFNVIRRVALTGSTGARQEVLIGYFNEISIGSSSFSAQQTILTGMQELNEACSMFIDGILGYSFFSQGIVSINFPKREFSFYLYATQ